MMGKDMFEYKYLIFFAAISVSLVLVKVALNLRPKSKAISSDSESRGLSQVLLYLVMFLIFWLPSVVTMAFSSFAIVLCVIEGSRCFQHTSQRKVGKVCYWFSLIYLPALPWVAYYFSQYLILFGGVYLTVVLFGMIITQDIKSSCSQFALALNLLLLSFIFQLFSGIRIIENGMNWLLFLFFLVNLADVFAYTFGSLYGRRKLLPKVSPGKSKEGALGSLILTCLMSILFSYILKLPINWMEAIFLGVVLNILSVMGDLALSLIKRDIGIKDYGQLIPGHGGFLDRFDSFIFTLPAFYYFIMIYI